MLQITGQPAAAVRAQVTPRRCADATVPYPPQSFPTASPYPPQPRRDATLTSTRPRTESVAGGRVADPRRGTAALRSRVSADPEIDFGLLCLCPGARGGSRCARGRAVAAAAPVRKQSQVPPA